MYDGLGDITDIWRGNAVRLCTPDVGPRPPINFDRPALGFQNATDPHFMRLSVRIPYLPGAALMSYVAAVLPQHKELLARARSGLATRSGGAGFKNDTWTDIDEIDASISRTSRDFANFVAVGFEKLSVASHDTIARLENLRRLHSALPGLEDTVVELARRSLACADHGDSEIDGVVWPGIRGAAASLTRTGPLPEPPTWPSVNTLGFEDGQHDFETGERTLCGTGPRQLGLLLSDLCSEGTLGVNVRWIDYSTDEIQTSWSPGPFRTTPVLLRKGTRPAEAYFAFREASDVDFQASTRFRVQPLSEQLYCQDFYVYRGRVLLSYAPLDADDIPVTNILDHEVVRLSDDVASIADRIAAGRKVPDRAVSATLARRARDHAADFWARQAPLHRIRVTCGADGVARLAAIDMYGFQKDLTVPHNRVVAAFSRSREAMFRRISLSLSEKYVIASDTSAIDRIVHSVRNHIAKALCENGVESESDLSDRALSRLAASGRFARRPSAPSGPEADDRREPRFEFFLKIDDLEVA